jgi:hypothetical protein
MYYGYSRSCTGRLDCTPGMCPQVPRSPTDFLVDDPVHIVQIQYCCGVVGYWRKRSDLRRDRQFCCLDITKSCGLAHACLAVTLFFVDLEEVMLQ